MKYKIGDKLRVVSNENDLHCFTVGDVVTAVYFHKNHPLGAVLCVRENDEVANWVALHQVKPVEPLGNKIKNFFKRRKDAKE